MTTTTTTVEPTETDTFVTANLGDGNWEVTAPNGVWEITADTADLDTLISGAGVAGRVTFLVTGPNHHHGEFWAETMDEALAHVRTFGVDRRTAQA
jgi:hypothetical protein